MADEAERDSAQSSQQMPAARAALMQAAKELVSARPIEQISVKEILTRAGVSRGTFYKYFQDKRDILMAVFQDELAGNRWTDYGREWLERHTIFLADLRANRQFYLNALATPEFAREWRQQAIASNTSLLESATLGARVNNEVLRHYVRFFTVGEVEDIFDWLRDPHGISPEELARRQIGFIEYGLAGIVRELPLHSFATGTFSDGGLGGEDGDLAERADDASVFQASPIASGR